MKLGLLVLAACLFGNVPSVYTAEHGSLSELSKIAFIKKAFLKSDKSNLTPVYHYCQSQSEFFPLSYADNEVAPGSLDMLDSSNLDLIHSNEDTLYFFTLTKRIDFVLTSMELSTLQVLLGVIR